MKRVFAFLICGALSAGFFLSAAGVVEAQPVTVTNQDEFDSAANSNAPSIAIELGNSITFNGARTGFAEIQANTDAVKFTTSGADAATMQGNFGGAFAIDGKTRWLTTDHELELKFDNTGDIIITGFGVAGKYLMPGDTHGGAVYGGDVVYFEGPGNYTFANNQASANDLTSGSYNHDAGQGGAVFGEKSVYFGGSGNYTFESNRATGGNALVADGDTGYSGLGGAVCSDVWRSGTGVLFENGGTYTFKNNQATGGNASANGSDASYSGRGGAVYVGSAFESTAGVSLSFENNTAQGGKAVNSGEAYASGLGGAIFVGEYVEVNGATFIGNKASTVNMGDLSSGRGGAIFLDARQTGSAAILNASESQYGCGDIIFSGNTMNPGSKGVVPNSIYFGNISQGSDDGIAIAVFDVGDGAKFHMLDPMASQPDNMAKTGTTDKFGNLALTINKTGPGAWVLAGTSDMQSATAWTVSQGALHLVADATGAPAHIALANKGSGLEGVAPASFTLKNGTTLLVEPTASAAHKISGQTITLESGSKVGVAGFQYGPANIASGQRNVLVLAADKLVNESTISQTSGTLSIGSYSYEYSNLSWSPDGKTLSLALGSGAQNPELSGVPAVTGSSHMAAHNPAITALNGHNRGMFRSMAAQDSAANAGTTDLGSLGASATAPAAGETTRYRNDDQPNRVWFTPYYSYTDQSSSGGNAGYDLNTPGLALGFERLITDRAFAGLAVSISWPTYKGGGTDIDATDFTLALYGGGILPFGNIELDGHIGYGWTDYDQTRHVRGERYDSDYDGTTFFIGAGLGRTFALDDGFYLRPGAAYDYIRIDTDGFDEGEGAFTLSLDDYNQNLHRVKAGLEGGWESESGFLASLEVYYLGLYGDREAESSGRFVADPENGFSVVGNGLDENNLGIGVGLTLPAGPNLDLGIGYDALMGGDAITHQGTANVTFRF